jgi:hypothetical protein
MEIQMSATTEVSLKTSGFIIPSLPSLSTEEINSKVEAVNAEQIEALAKKMISNIMGRLQVDMLGYSHVEGRFKQDYLTGQQFPVMDDKYDHNSHFMRTLLPVVIKEITQSFSSPYAFLENGIHFSIFEDGFDGGLLSHIVNTNGKDFVEAKIQSLKTNFFGMKTLKWEMTLELNMQSTKDLGKLHFERIELMNENNVGYTEFTLESVQESALLCTVNM